MQRAASRSDVKSDRLYEFAKKHPKVAGPKSVENFLKNTAEGKALVAEFDEGPFLGYASYGSLNTVVMKLRKPATASTKASRRINAEAMSRARARAAESAVAAEPGSRISDTTQLEKPEVISLLEKATSGDFKHFGDSRVTTDWVALADAMDKDVTFGRAPGYFVPGILALWYSNHVTRKAKKST